MKMLTGIAEDGSKNRMGWGIISWFSIRKRLWESMRSKRLPGIFCALCVLRRLQPGRERIYTAGEMEYLKWLDRRDKGVPVGESVQRELAAVRDKLGLSQYVFPFERETSAEMNPDK